MFILFPKFSSQMVSQAPCFGTSGLTCLVPWLWLALVACPTQWLCPLLERQPQGLGGLTVEQDEEAVLPHQLPPTECWDCAEPLSQVQPWQHSAHAVGTSSELGICLSTSLKYKNISLGIIPGKKSVANNAKTSITRHEWEQNDAQKKNFIWLIIAKYFPFILASFIIFYSILFNYIYENREVFFIHTVDIFCHLHPCSTKTHVEQCLATVILRVVPGVGLDHHVRNRVCFVTDADFPWISTLKISFKLGKSIGSCVMHCTGDIGDHVVDDFVIPANHHCIERVKPFSVDECVWVPVNQASKQKIF